MAKNILGIWSWQASHEICIIRQEFAKQKNKKKPNDAEGALSK